MTIRYATLAAVIGVVSVTVSVRALAHEDYSEAGSLHWLEHVSQTGSTPEAVRLERESQKNWISPDVDNRAEGVGGLGLYDARNAAPTTEAQMARKRENEKGLDRGKDNHEEGVGGHGLYEATKKK
jgi:hypothetical protein